METLRRNLYAKVDDLLAEISNSHDDLNGATNLQLEASVTRPSIDGASFEAPRKIILGSIDISALTTSSYRDLANTLTHGDDAAIHSRLSSEGSTPNNRSPDSPDVIADQALSLSRRKAVGGLRLGNVQADDTIMSPPKTPPPPTARQLETDVRHFPKRRKINKDGPAKLERATVDKLIEGIWEQIHHPHSLALGPDLSVVIDSIAKQLSSPAPVTTTVMTTFEDASRCCQQITAGTRTGRALEVIFQAYWVGCYENRIADLREKRADLKTYEIKKVVMNEACKLFQWSEKELRNHVAIWRGYHEIKNAAGWSALVFAGPGIYRFCKYRLGFDQEAIAKLQLLRTRAEVAADTIQPHWRRLLALVGEPTEARWSGHPHDWVVSKRKEPVPLALTYRQWDPNFEFAHLEESKIDKDIWGDTDPRRSSNGPEYTCDTCSAPQSLSAEKNECQCFPTLFGPNPRTPAPVQVYRTENGRNNGLIACCTFERGVAIGEFVGFITKGLTGVDVMQSQIQSQTIGPYQIYQGRFGNFTRFINHSCQPNCQFQTFTWLGVQRIVVVSKGIPAGKELTVDYSGRYWKDLDKVCLCGEARCRYGVGRN